MNNNLLNDITKYVEEHIGEFHAARIAILQNMNLKEILKRKNPYMYRAMRPMSVSGLVVLLIDDALYEINNDLFKEWMKDVTSFILHTIGNIHCEAPHVITLSEFCDKDDMEMLIREVRTSDNNKVLKAVEAMGESRENVADKLQQLLDAAEPNDNYVHLRFL